VTVSFNGPWLAKRDALSLRIPSPRHQNSWGSVRVLGGIPEPFPVNFFSRVERNRLGSLLLFHRANGFLLVMAIPAFFQSPLRDLWPCRLAASFASNPTAFPTQVPCLDHLGTPLALFRLALNFFFFLFFAAHWKPSRPLKSLKISSLGLSPS